MLQFDFLTVSIAEGPSTGEHEASLSFNREHLSPWPPTLVFSGEQRALSKMGFFPFYDTTETFNESINTPYFDAVPSVSESGATLEVTKLLFVIEAVVSELKG